MGKGSAVALLSFHSSVKGMYVNRWLTLKILTIIS